MNGIKSFKGSFSRLWSARGADTTAPDMLTIGALTAVGAGARSIFVADGTYGPYTVSGGVLTPNTSPVGPGSYDVGGTMITAEADTYDVASAAEYATVLALGGATLSGKTIKGLPGVDLAGTSAGDIVAYPATLVLSAPLTVTSRNPASPCYHRRANFRQNGTIHFKDMTIRDTYILSDNFQSANILQFSAPSSGRSKVILDGVTATGGDVASINNSVVLQAAAAAHTNGVSSTTITLTGSPDLSSVATDRSMAVRLGSANYAIVGKDDGAKTLTVSAAANIPLASPVDYIICYVPKVLSLIGQDGGISSRPDIEITDCNFSNFRFSLTGGSGWNDLLAENSEFDQTSGDHLQIIVIGNEARVDVLRNKFKRAHGWFTDPLNPHTDAVQFVCMNMTTDNTVPYRVIGNQLWQADGRAHATQFVFVEGAPSARRVLMTVEHNIGMSASSHGITIERPAVGTVIRGNTTIFDNSGTDPQPLLPAITSNVGYPAIDAGVTVGYNIATSVSSTSAETVGNYAFGATEAANEGADYAAVFAGAAGQFQGGGLSSFAEFRAALTPDTTTLWPTGRVRRGAMSGYYDYTTGTSDAPWDEDGWDASGSWGNITGAETGAAVVSTKRQVTGVSATGTALAISGGVSPSLTIYDTDGSTMIVSGVPDALATEDQWVEVHDTASGTGSTLSTVTITAGTTSGTWTHETAAAAYSPNAVELDGTNDWLYLNSGFSATGGKQALVAFSFYVPTAWPSSGTVLNMANAGGFAQITVAFNSYRHLVITARNSGGTPIASYLSANNGFNHSEWWTVAIELDTNTGKGWRVYRRLAGGSWVLDTPNTQSFTVDGIMAACTRCYVGAANSMYLSDVYASIDRTLDLSVSGNRDLFLPLADKGLDGSTPTGTAPALFLSGATGSWHTNKGAGGGLTLSGALTTAPSAPT